MTRENRRSTLSLAIAILSGSAVCTGALAEALPGGTLDPTTIPKYVTDLVIPGVMKPSDDPNRDYQIESRQFKQQMLPRTGCEASDAASRHLYAQRRVQTDQGLGLWTRRRHPAAGRTGAGRPSRSSTTPRSPLRSSVIRRSRWTGSMVWSTKGTST